MVLNPVMKLEHINDTKCARLYLRYWCCVDGRSDEASIDNILVQQAHDQDIYTPSSALVE